MLWKLQVKIKNSAVCEFDHAKKLVCLSEQDIRNRESLRAGSLDCDDHVRREYFCLMRLSFLLHGIMIIARNVTVETACMISKGRPAL